MQSPDDTIITLPNESIVDADGNQWAMSNGQVTIDGIVDSSTANVIEMAYVDGVVWQKNADNLWWGKTAPTAQWSPTFGTGTSPISPTLWQQSPNDSTVTVAVPAPIVDVQGNKWTIANGQVLVNGVADPTTARVIGLVYVNDQIWQQNADNLWWGKSSPTGPWLPPDGASAPPGGTPQDIMTLSSAGEPITDGSGNTWAIVEGQVTLNGIPDGTTANVIELAYVNGKIWQENENHLWWSKSKPSDQWGPDYGTADNPVQAITRTWHGQDGAFSTAGDWNPNGVPQAGDTAVVQSGSVMVNPGDATGVNFVLQSPSATVEFNHGGTYDIGDIQGTGTVSADGFYNPGAMVISTGVHLTSGAHLVLNQIAFGQTFALNGNSSLTGGSDLTVKATGINHQPVGSLGNNGTMEISASSLDVGFLNGTGHVKVINQGTVQVQLSAASSETIQLQSGHLEIGGSVPAYAAMHFLAPITEFGDNSSITLDNTQATAEMFAKTSPTAGELFLYNGSTVVADLHISGQSNLYAGYDPSASNSGAVTISTVHTDQSLPIVTHAP
jgi:hypothetical protein